MASLEHVGCLCVWVCAYFIVYRPTVPSYANVNQTRFTPGHAARRSASADSPVRSAPRAACTNMCMHAAATHEHELHVSGPQMRQDCASWTLCGGRLYRALRSSPICSCLVGLYSRFVQAVPSIAVIADALSNVLEMAIEGHIRAREFRHSKRQQTLASLGHSPRVRCRLTVVSAKHRRSKALPMRQRPE